MWPTIEINHAIQENDEVDNGIRGDKKNFKYLKS